MFWFLQCLSEVKCQIHWNLCFVSWQHGIHSNKTFQSDVTNTTSICTELFMQRWYSAFKRQLFEKHSLHSLYSTLTYFKACRKLFTSVKLTEESHCRKLRRNRIALFSQCHRSVTENQIWLNGRVSIFITKKPQTSPQKSVSNMLWYLDSKLLENDTGYFSGYCFWKATNWTRD